MKNDEKKTVKRFTIDKDGITVIDNCTNGLIECKYSNEAKLLCNFLNELHEENTALKVDRHRFEEEAKLFALSEMENELNDLHEENKQLKQDVEYWKQVASQYSNELNVFEHCKKYKTEYKDKIK